MKASRLAHVLSAALLAYACAASADQPNWLPPWNTPPTNGLSFAVAPFDYVVDLHGDVVNPQLTIFFAGNQFMAVPALIAAFKKAHPKYQRIFVETLPPGKLAAQIDAGALIMGNLRIDAKADIYTAGKKRIEDIQREKHWFTKSYDYADNKLAIMVPAGNPKQVHGIADLGRADVRVSMPNPQFEGIAKQIEAIYKKVGGDALDQTIMQTKVQDGSTILTQIHHRQSPLNILDGHADAAPVWYTETYFQQQVLHHPVETVEIPDADNLHVTYTAAILRAAPHPQAAKDFLAFLATPGAQAVYQKYGFEPPSEPKP